MDELQGFVSGMLSDAGKTALESPAAQEAVATLTGAAVRAAKREVLTMVFPAFILGVLVAKYVK